MFCARLFWREDLWDVHLAGSGCFMKSPDQVAELLAWEEYHRHWPKIPAAELQASSVHLRLGASDEYRLVLLHKRRVSKKQARGEEPAFVCEDCHDAFSPATPFMCKYALANHLYGSDDGIRYSEMRT